MWWWISGISGALAVACGAFGAHGLKARVEPELLDIWQTAAHYHLLHAIVLLALTASPQPPTLGTWLILVGTIIFSGSLYTLVLTDTRWLGAITPIGGVCLILGWLTIAYYGAKSLQ
jgi:uncharacterized membrane protein YgdD (TMEM256/DUF423 family)